MERGQEGARERQMEGGNGKGERETGKLGRKVNRWAWKEGKEKKRKEQAKGKAKGGKGNGKGKRKMGNEKVAGRERGRERDKNKDRDRELIGFERLIIHNLAAKREAIQFKKSRILAGAMEIIGFDRFT